jgi:apolipoprotein N-acyltransferase
VRPGRSEGLAALSAVLLALSFPKFGHGLVAWVALTPLMVALAEARGPGHGFRLGYLTGALASLGIVYWTAIVVVQYGGQPLPVGVAVMCLLCLALALFTSLFGWLVARWVRAHGYSALLLSPVAWVATEILRAHTLFDFSWCLLGYSQHGNLTMIQLARYGAVYLVSFLVAGVSAALAYVLLERRRGARTAVVLATLAVLAVAWMHGEWRLARPLPEAGRLRVGLVQASILQEDKWDAAHAWDNVMKHVELTHEAARSGARLVVWPESSLPFLFDREPAVAAMLRQIVATDHIYLLFGNDDREEGEAARRIWVGAKMLDPAGNLALRYHKIRLVPFGEYVPMQSVLTLGGRFSAKLVQEVGEFAPGEDYAVGQADGHPVAAFICYEAIFPDLVREFAARGAQLLVNITNDGWYGRTSAPYQHFAMAKFRAVENERYLVRAANTGISAVVDAHGRVLEQTGLFERAVVVRDVPLLAGSTFYSRHGDVFAWSCLAGAAGLTLAGLRRRS